MNREKALRKGVYEALFENLVLVGYTGPLENYVVPVYDSKLETPDEVYCLITTQFSIYDGNFTKYSWRATIELEIFHMQQNSATNDVVDDIGEAIEAIIIPTQKPTGNGIIQQPGWLITNVQCDSVTNLKMRMFQDNAATVVSKTIQFKTTIIKQA